MSYDINNITPSDVSKLAFDQIQSLLKAEFNRLTKRTTLQEILKEDLSVEVGNSSDNSSSEASDEEQEHCYYRQMDKSNSTRYDFLLREESIIDLTEAQSREEINEIVGKSKLLEDESDKSYRELLEWDLKVPDDFQQVYPETTKEPVSDFYESFTRTPKSPKPEYLVTPPKDIVEEGDIVLYPKNYIVGSVTSNDLFSPMEQANESKSIDDIDVTPLETTTNRVLLHLKLNKIIQEPASPELDSSDQNFSKIASFKIAQLRKEMASFTKTLEDFNQKTKYFQAEIDKQHRGNNCKRPWSIFERTILDCTEKEKRDEEKEIDTYMYNEEWIGRDTNQDSKFDGDHQRLNDSYKHDFTIKRTSAVNGAVGKRGTRETIEIREELTVKRTVRCSLEMQMARNRDEF